MPAVDIPIWRAEAMRQPSKSKLMRAISEKYSAPKNDVGAMLYAIFDDFTMDDLIYIWKWDMERAGVGISDERIDILLVHLQSCVANNS
ncbi:hypothetical protein [Jeongeupia naejangsanensis]